jgi:hypothetical protein
LFFPKVALLKKTADGIFECPAQAEFAMPIFKILQMQKMTSRFRFGGICLALCGLCALPATAQGRPQQDFAAGDGSHDFDFNTGVWKTHIRRLQHPLSGSSDAIELNGTVTVRKVWDGRAQLEEIEADGPNGHWEGTTLFLYNPLSHQWSQTFADSKNGILGRPLIGAFANGRGELVSQDSLAGRAILIRGVWSNITANAHHFEEDYSGDGGKNWEHVFVADLTRKTP